MAIYDTNNNEPSDLERAEMRIRRSFYHIITGMEQNLNRINAIVEKYGKTAIAQQIGADAPGLQSAYKALKNCLATITPDKTVDDLPDA